MAGNTISVTLALKNSVTSVQLDQLQNALLALGSLGGLGSRSRKGFGSLSIQSMGNHNGEVPVPNSLDQLSTLYKSWNTECSLPPFTAFSTETRIDISKTGGASSALRLLEDTGQKLQKYRAYGRAINGIHRVCGEYVEGKQNFQSDHDLVLDIINGDTPESMPDRSVFGLPHNYFYSSVFQSEFTNERERLINKGCNQNKAERKAKCSAKKKASVDFSLDENRRQRRASPLFIHVHEFPNGNTAIIQSLFPAKFLNDGDKLSFKNNGRTCTVLFNSSMADYDYIRTYMNQFTARGALL